MHMSRGQFQSSMALNRARSLLSTVADYRADKVAVLKSAVSHGFYHVDSYSIARKMVDEALQECASKRRR